MWFKFLTIKVISSNIYQKNVKEKLAERGVLDEESEDDDNEREEKESPNDQKEEINGDAGKSINVID